MTKVLQLLGTGGSTGIPMVGCGCGVCKSSNTANKRLRAQGLFRLGDKNILIDAGPDIRQQAIKYGIESVDAIFITHYHEDHIGGFDDLRGFYFTRGRKPIPVYLSENSYEMIAMRFGYLLERFEFIKLDDHAGTFEACGYEFSYFAYEQGSVPVLGFRHETAAYLTDVKSFDEKIFDWLSGVKNVVVSALNFKGSHMHLSLDEACDFGARAGAESTYIIHVNHEIEYDTISKTLRDGVYLSIDGMEIDV